MEIISQNISKETWDRAVSVSPDLSLLQTWEFAQAKATVSPWRFQPILFRQAGESAGAAMVMLRKLPVLKGGLAWVNRGPIGPQKLDQDQERMAQMLTALRQHWVEKKGFHLRLALPVALDRENPEVLQACGFTKLTDEGWASARLDLRQGCEDLRSQLKQKWRNCLNKSEKQSVEIISGSHDDLLTKFLTGYEQMLAGKNLNTSVTPQFLRALHGQYGSHSLMAIHLGALDGEVIGGVLTVRYGQTGEYLCAWSDYEHRKLNVNYLLIWQAINHLKSEGCQLFDMGGMVPGKTPKGIMHFKSGLNGLPYQYMGEIEATGRALLSKVIRQKISPS